MSKYYLDTSALVKVYHREAGTGAVLNIYRSDDEIAISELNKIELLSAAYRKYREHEITHEALAAVTEKFEDDIDERYDVLKFSSLVVDEARSLLRRFAEDRALKALDSIQFAFFSIYCDRQTVFVCADATLDAIARDQGIQALCP